MIVSRITSKAQTTIPQSVRKALALGPGDELAHQIDVDGVILTKAEGLAMPDPFAAFDEWSSEADRRAYADFYAGRDREHLRQWPLKASCFCRYNN